MSFWNKAKNYFVHGASGAAGGALTGALVGSIVPGIGTAAGALYGAGAGLVSGLGKGYEASKADEMDEWNKNFQEKVNNQQNWYNQNAYQIQAADMQKIGLNPASLGASGASVGSVSGSEVNHAVAGDSMDFMSLVREAAQLKSQQYIAHENNETSQSVANTQAKSAVDVAEINASTQAAHDSAQMEIARLNNESAEKVAAGRNASAERISANEIKSREKVSANELEEIKRKNKAAESLTERELALKQQELMDKYEAAYKAADLAQKQYELSKSRWEAEKNLQIFREARDSVLGVSREARNWFNSVTFQNIFGSGDSPKPPIGFNPLRD